MSYQTIYNPYTGQIKVVDLSQPGAQSQIMSLYQQGWTSASAQQTQYAQQQAPQMYQPQPAQPPPQPVKVVQTETKITQTPGKVYVPENYTKDLPNLGPGAKKNIVETRGISFDEYNKRLRAGEDLSKYHVIASAQEYAALGPGVKSKVQVDVKLKWYEHLTSVKEEEGEQVTAKSFALQVGDAVVPFMYTARNWNEMEDWEKGVHLFADTVFSVGYLKSGKALATTLKGKVTTPATKPITSVTERTASGQLKVMTPTNQARAEYQTIQKLAKDAGETMRDFQLKRAAVAQAEELGVIPKNIALPGNQVQRTLLNSLQVSAQRAKVAGRAFAETFPNVSKLTPAQLKKIEKLSGFKGLAKSVKQIATLHAELEKQWAIYDKVLAQRGISDWFTRLKLKDIELTQKQLQKAYTQYHNVIRPQRLYSTKGPSYRIPQEQLIALSKKANAGNLADAYENLALAKKLQRSGKLTRQQLKQVESNIDDLQSRIRSLLKEAEAEADFKPEVPEASPPDKLGGGYGSQGQWTKKQFDEEVKRVADINAKDKQQAFWELQKEIRTKTAVQEQEKVKEKLEELWKTKKQLTTEKAPEAIPAKEKIKAPKVDKEPKFGMKPKEKVKVTAREIPQEVRGRRTFAQIAREYGESAVEDAIGVPISGLNTARQVKTATQINQEFQDKLCGATQAATSALVNTYQATQNWNQSFTDAMNAVDTYLQLQPQTQTQAQAQTQLVIKTAVRQAVKELLETKPRPIPKKLPVGPDDEPKLEIERVEGVPRNPGIIRWNKGVVQVEIVPPYREGSEDIHFKRLKQPQTGKGSQERTLEVLKGQAPKLVVLGKQGGIAKTHIIRGKRMKHIRQIVSQRGPGIIDSRGRLHRQKRGSVI